MGAYFLMTIYDQIKKALFPNDRMVIAITGLSKNAGKTSLVNWILKHYSVYRFGLTTTGRDGEDKDTVFGTEKPKVLIAKNTIFTTFADEIKRNPHCYEVLERTRYKAGGKDIWIVKAIMDTEAEIVGPASVTDQKEIIERLRILGASTIIIDGSLDRKAVLLNDSIQAMIIAAGANYGSIEMIVKELRRLQILKSIPVTKEFSDKTEFISLYKDEWITTNLMSLLGNEKRFLELCHEYYPDRIYIPGAITGKNWHNLGSYFLDFHGEIIIKHPFNLQLDLVNVKLMQEEMDIKTIYPFLMNAIAVNSSAINGNHVDSEGLASTIREYLPELPVVDILNIE